MIGKSKGARKNSRHAPWVTTQQQQKHDISAAHEADMDGSLNEG
jgi:hypothetical protein